MVGKNNLVKIFVMAIAVFLFFHQGVWADQELTLEFWKGSDNKIVTMPAIDGDTTYLPVRQVSELINISLNWDSDIGAVIWQTYNQTTVITPEIDTVYTISEAVTPHKTAAKPIISQGRVYIPMRTLELLGIGVAYDAKTTQRSLFIPADLDVVSEPVDQEKLNLVRDLIIKEKDQIPKKIGSFITSFNASDRSRTQNLKLAAEAINNFRVTPGKVFSFNETVGPRSPERGYEKATIFVNKQHVEGYGGGVCQVSTTLYNAVQAAGLQIVERHPHSLPVPYVPLGKDATVNYGTADFKFKNNGERDIEIQTSVQKNKLTVEIYSLAVSPETELPVD